MFPTGERQALHSARAIERAGYGRTPRQTVERWLAQYGTLAETGQPPQPGHARPDVIKEIENELAQLVERAGYGRTPQKTIDNWLSEYGALAETTQPPQPV